MRKKIQIINGANVNLLGEREIGIYGTESYETINKELSALAERLSLDLSIYHSNIEGELINKIQEVRNTYQGIIINAGAYTHYSYAIRSAIAAINIPTIEVQFSNINKKEEMRRESVIAPVCVGQITGLGKLGYKLALYAFSELLGGV